MYIINGSQTFGDAYIGGQLVVQPIGSAVQMNVENTHWNTTVGTAGIEVNAAGVDVDGNLTVTGADGGVLRLSALAGAGDRSIGVDASGAVIELPGGGGSFDISDDFGQTYPVNIGDAITVRGRPGNTVLKTYFSSTSDLEIRLEGGSSGQILGYDSDFGVGWVNGILTYSDIITPIGGSPLVITHNWGTTKVQVSVYDTATGEEVTPTVVSRDNNNVRITMPTSNEIEIVIIGFN